MRKRIVNSASASGITTQQKNSCCIPCGLETPVKLTEYPLNKRPENCLSSVGYVCKDPALGYSQMTLGDLFQHFSVTL